ncbi:MAG TPA: zinc-ribbon domain-containing protein [Nitrospirota bacterium]
MFVECPSCKARYNLNLALIGGSRGARVRCRKCGDRFDVRIPEMPPPQEAVGAPGMETEPEKETRPPEPSQAPTVALKVPVAVESLSLPKYQYPERKSHRSGRGRRTHPSGGKAAYYLAGSIGIVLVITMALLVHFEFRRGLPSVPDNTSRDVRIISSQYTRSPWGEQLYVLRGSVRDIRKGANPAPIRLRAKLFNGKKDLLAEKTFPVGSDIPEIGVPARIALDNTVLEEGWLPFLVIFFDPGVIADYSVTIEPM